MVINNKVNSVALAVIAITAVWFVFVHLPNTQVKSETHNKSKGEILDERFNKYYDYLQVGLCKEAYELHTKQSKLRTPFDKFQIHCTITQRWERDFIIDKAVFSTDSRADIRYTYNQMGIDETNPQFQECIASPYSSLQSCASNASTTFKGKKEDLATWIYEDGQWYRDF